MDKKNNLIEEIKNEFDLKRIKNLSLSEKFKLAELNKLIYNEALYCEMNGIKNLANSINYTKNKTYSLFGMLAINGMKEEIFIEIASNYARNFKKSDSYYSQVSIIGIGILLMMKGMEPKSILNYLMLLLGEEFLATNLKYPGYIKDISKEKIDIDLEIKYKPFEGKMRVIKYELLALLKLSHNESLEYVNDIINNSYDNRLLMLYYNMMDIKNEKIIDEIYNEFKLNSSRTERLLLCGAYCIHKGFDVFTTHYLFNSIIGKYSRYDKEVEEIENEIELRKKEIINKFNN